eukprot:TRINITY_DN6974_c0_g1_i2.p2 TRINITY_DN6974_c0_g1~~TRINITY_DN6974_c0_g1_i2.p2  ORF type:complete len:146 (+),score=10.11 TRINITY_DN6974_c0_g1_i2:401-838(+)
MMIARSKIHAPTPPTTKGSTLAGCAGGEGKEAEEEVVVTRVSAVVSNDAPSLVCCCVTAPVGEFCATPVVGNLMEKGRVVAGIVVDGTMHFGKISFNDTADSADNWVFQALSIIVKPVFLTTAKKGRDGRATAGSFPVKQGELVM